MKRLRSVCSVRTPRTWTAPLCLVLFTLLLAQVGVHAAAQAVGQSLSDPCKDIATPTLTDQEAKKILSRRRKYNCNKIYNSRQKSFSAKIVLSQNRFVELGAKTETIPLTEIGKAIANKEKGLCLKYTAIPEITEEAYRCRQREIDEWEKSLLIAVSTNRKLEEDLTRVPDGKLSEQKRDLLRSQLADNLIENLDRIISRGQQISEEIDSYEMKKWRSSQEK